MLKIDGRWAGKVYSKVTKECYDGITYSDVTAQFRAYGGWTESVADHSAFLRTDTRYKAVIGEKNYQTACKAIKVVFFAKAKQSGQTEVFNDLDGELVNLYRCIKYHRAAVDPMIRSLYEDFNIEGISRRQTLSGKGDNKTRFSEVIIKNY